MPRTVCSTSRLKQALPDQHEGRPALRRERCGLTSSLSSCRQILLQLAALACACAQLLDDSTHPVSLCGDITTDRFLVSAALVHTTG